MYCTMDPELRKPMHLRTVGSISRPVDNIGEKAHSYDHFVDDVVTTRHHPQTSLSYFPLSRQADTKSD